MIDLWHTANEWFKPKKKSFYSDSRCIHVPSCQLIREIFPIAMFNVAAWCFDRSVQIKFSGCNRSW